MAIDTEERTTNSPNKGDNKNNNKKILIIVLVIVGVLILLGIAGSIAAGYFINKGVEKVAEKGIEAATGGNVEIDANGSGDITFKDKDGKASVSVGSKAEMPEDFPSEVPVYEGAKVFSSSSFGVSSEGKTFSVVLTTDDNAEQVHAFYKQAFSANGWSTASQMDMNDIQHVTANNTSKNLYGSASISSEEGQTKILLGARTNANTAN